jgi:hypothetical protein
MDKRTSTAETLSQAPGTIEALQITKNNQNINLKTNAVIPETKKKLNIQTILNNTEY